MRVTVFSAIAIAIVVGASISLSYVGLNNGTFPPTPSNSTDIAAVQGGNNNTIGSSAETNSSNTITNSNLTGGNSSMEDMFTVLPDDDPPVISDTGLKVEKVAEGLDLPTSMAFIDRDDILILEKESGMVRLLSGGELQDEPVLELVVESNSERGLLGIAVQDNANGTKTVFLYCTQVSGDEVRNRVYKYNMDHSGNLSGEALVLDLPGEPGPNHDGGKLKIGPDGMLYVVIGDLNRDGVLQNYEDGGAPDDTSVILRVDSEGNAPTDSPMPGNLAKYYAYGIRNSFGLDFDPLTGVLWDTENGPTGYDEINVVKPGLNSGWEQVMGPIGRSGNTLDDLVQLEGSHYADPVFSWAEAQGITDIEFLNSTRLGGQYAYNIFVGDFNNGNLYFFTVNKTRDGLELSGNGLQDLVADDSTEAEAVTFGTGFGAISDIETGPDGYLYILAYSGELYRIVPAAH
ncbi:MAG TPA: PQQ-dependent sugar dehydrogenase [Nitrososphaera sp.]|nr:PQQ-dependent sugar dehydrogenase [Nitrososphaera sp.]